MAQKVSKLSKVTGVHKFKYSNVKYPKSSLIAVNTKLK